MLVQFGLNFLKQQGVLPIVIDYLHFALNSKCFVARERCEFISRLLNNNVVATKNNIKADYDVKSLGTRKRGIQKKSKAKMATTTVSCSKSMPTSPPCAQKQVFSTKTASSKFVIEKKNSRSQSPSAERSTSSSSERSQSSSSQCSQSAPPKKQINKKLVKNKQDQRPLKAKIKRTTPTSYSRATPILNRLRAKPNGRIDASSSSTSSSRNVTSGAKSKNKKIGCRKKLGHSSDDEENDENKLM
jgi:hypothetical protein